MAETKIGVKSKVRVSPKVATGVILVCIGVALGAVAFNALVPATFAPTSDTSAIAATAQTWTYVFGPDKNKMANFNQLKNLINDGADVKIIGGAGGSELCRSVYLSGPVDNDEIIVCRTVPEFSADNSAPVKGDGWQFVVYHYILHSTKLNEVDILYDNAHQYSNGEILSGVSTIPSGPVKWYVKK